MADVKRKFQKYDKVSPPWMTKALTRSRGGA